jgi:putative serine protease PepD
MGGGRDALIRSRGVAVAAAVLAVVVLTAVLAYRAGSGGTPMARPSPTPTPSPTKPPTPADVYTAVAPSIVSIDAAHGTGGDSGTGVVVNADATILTALHVVKGVDAIRVTFADGTTSPASLAASDPAMDIAILTPATLPSVVVPALLGSSNRLAVGENVIAIGNQLGLTRSTTTGVVSGLDRRATGPDGTSLSGLIQFDAAVNPGSSGGPLLDGRGETIGIVVALANPTAAATFIGVGFAVPIGAAVAAGGGSRAPQQ